MSSSPRPWWHELEEIRTAIERSPGGGLLRESQELSRSLSVFNRNSDELISVLEVFGGPYAILFWTEGQDAQLEALLAEIDQRLHNYLASVKSLADHTRVLVQGRYVEDSALRSSYEARKDAVFVRAPRAQFLQQLRHYALHVRLPNPVGSLAMTQPAQSRVLLQTADLLQWPKWNEPARQYLNAAGAEIELIGAVRGYTAEVREFYIWFSDQREAEHADELAEVHRLHAELEAAIVRTGLPDHLAAVDKKRAEEAPEQ